MKAIILAAGYATRLFPLTENLPKPLLPIAGRPMVEHIMDKAAKVGIKEVSIVTNSKFVQQFQDWAFKSDCAIDDISIVDDGTTTNENRLGGIGDIQFTIEQEGINDDLLVLGGDNIYKFELTKAYELFKKHNKPTIICFDVQTIDLAKRYGIVDMAPDGKVKSFVEKPKEPASTNAAICVYFYPKSMLPMIKEFLASGGNKDGPGNLIPWLLTKKIDVYAVSHKEDWFDVGGFDSLRDAKVAFGEKDVDVEKLKKGII